MKVIAWYLPQFHEIPENDKWWGKGFTEWTNVKKAEALAKDHNQPRVPLNNNYYNLLDDEVKKWQVDLAKKYGIYGFCMHHYWFDGKLLLEKPVEQYLENKSLDLPFCLNWANEHWTNQWKSNSERVLIEQHYGGREQWEQHFNYLLPFFQDSRYIKIEGKPLFSIYRPEFIDNLNDMLDCWNELALANGLPGMAFAYVGMKWDYVNNKDDSRFMYDIEYQPSLCWNAERQNKFWVKIYNHIPNWFEEKFSNAFSILKGLIVQFENTKANVRDYDETWETILKWKPKSDKSVPGAFVDWDNTPRKGERGIYLQGASPEKFKIYFKKQVERAKSVYNKDIIFIFSWNEWCEGGYLEPDEKNGYKYLEGIASALDKVYI